MAPTTGTDAPGAAGWHRAWIGLGANLGDPPATLRAALAELATDPRMRIEACSSFYRTAPLDAGGPDFVNAVARVLTTAPPDALLATLQAIERRHGRERPYRNAPRLLDLDLLLYDSLRLHDPALTLPHPRMHERAFVLAPLAELAPDLPIGTHGRAAQLLATLGAQSVERLAAPTALMPETR